MRHTKNLALASAAAIGLRTGIASVRMDAGDAAAEVRRLIEDVTKKVENKLADQAKAWDDFKAANNAAKDGLDAAGVAKINSAMTEMGAELDKLNNQLAMLKAGAGIGEDRPGNTPEQKAYSKAYGSFFRKGAENGLRDLEVKAAMTAGSDPDGGYLVPFEMETTIDRVLAKVSAMRQLATVRPISAAVYKKPFNAGGSTGGWVGETGGRNQTQNPALKLLEFPAMELYAMPAATQTLLDDAFVDIGAWLADEVSIVFAEQEGDAFINGDGSAKPYGLLSAPTAADSANLAWGKLGYVQIGTGGAFAADATAADGLVDLCYAPKQGYRSNGTWLMNRKTAGTVRKFKDGNGHYLWQPALALGQPDTLLGYPVASDDNMPDVGANAFPVAFGDFKRGYIIVDRIGIRTLRDPFSSKPYVLFYTTKRVGGGIQNFEAIKLGKIAA